MTFAGTTPNATRPFSAATEKLVSFFRVEFHPGQDGKQPPLGRDTTGGGGKLHDTCQVTFAKTYYQDTLRGHAPRTCVKTYCEDILPGHARRHTSRTYSQDILRGHLPRHTTKTYSEDMLPGHVSRHAAKTYSQDMHEDILRGHAPKTYSEDICQDILPTPRTCVKTYCQDILRGHLTRHTSTGTYLISCKKHLKPF